MLLIYGTRSQESKVRYASYNLKVYFLTQHIDNARNLIAVPLRIQNRKGFFAAFVKAAGIKRSQLVGKCFQFFQDPIQLVSELLLWNPEIKFNALF